MSDELDAIVAEIEREARREAGYLMSEVLSGLRAGDFERAAARLILAARQARAVELFDMAQKLYAAEQQRDAAYEQGKEFSESLFDGADYIPRDEHVEIARRLTAECIKANKFIHRFEGTGWTFAAECPRCDENFRQLSDLRAELRNSRKTPR